jgi:hypothetical protein
MTQKASGTPQYASKTPQNSHVHLRKGIQTTPPDEVVCPLIMPPRSDPKPNNDEEQLLRGHGNLWGTLEDGYGRRVSFRFRLRSGLSL